MKFLANDSRTLAALRSSTSEAVILSHYIWSAGQLMEGKIKGMLCNLLHQILGLPKNLEVAHAALNRFPAVGCKDSDSDWTEKELRDALLFSFCRSRQRYCLFIDGLDEIHSSDGPAKLLRLLLDIITGVPGLKICVSSRPEPILQRHLSGVPSFRIQDLTCSDVWLYSSGVLEDTLRRSNLILDPGHCQTLVSQLCHMAEGVFLWVCLAVRSLVTGLEKRDGFDTLVRRLDVVPRDVRGLYSSMWDRMGTEKEVYQAEAAIYLNLILNDLEMEPLDWLQEGELLPLHILLATNEEL